MLRRLLFLSFALAFQLTLGAAEPPAARYARVSVAPTKTSVYVATVTMKMPTFVRHGGTYAAPYKAEVFPFFFENENGTLSVDVSDAQLDALAHGKTIEFTGRALRSDGIVRRVEARATPRDATAGALKVKVYVSKRIVLVFNTTYRFEAAAPTS